jgi:hypothetical protein
LAGAWGRSEAACQAGVTAHFDADAVRLEAPSGAEVLLERPRYTLDRDARVTIRFALPDAPGGVSGAGGEGVLVIEGAEEGRLRVVARRFVDRRTGGVSAVLDPAEDAIAATLSLIRCAGAAEGAKLRGRS